MKSRSGDIWMMPGVFLVRGDAVLWSDAYRSAADHPDFARIPQLARDARAADAGPDAGGGSPLG